MSVGDTGGAAVVALLRGVNVGGRTLAMADLRTICTQLGYEGVTTYIQSGNVILRTDPARAAQVPAELAQAILAQTGMSVDVLVRSGAELSAVLGGNPFGGPDATDPYVTFLAAPPVGASIDPDAGLPDRFVLGDRVVYVSCPGGYGRTVLNNAFFERRLGVSATTRNWRTVERLAAMLADAG